MNVAEARRRAQERLHGAGIESAEAESWLILEGLLRLPRADLLLRRSEPLTSDQHAKLEAWLRRREAREPLQHILGVAHFYGLELSVSPDVLIPRPETEALVALALARLRGRGQPRVLDAGTGSGAIALALKAERPDSVVWGTDVSPQALAAAAANARKLELGVHFALSDLLLSPSVQDFARTLDLLVSNPPYLPERDSLWLSPEVRRDPPGALFSGKDGLEHFRRLTGQAHSLLEPGALCLFELDPRNVVQAWQESSKWAARTVRPDLLGRERFLELVR